MLICSFWNLLQHPGVPAQKMAGHRLHAGRLAGHFSMPARFDALVRFQFKLNIRLIFFLVLQILAFLHKNMTSLILHMNLVVIFF